MKKSLKCIIVVLCLLFLGLTACSLKSSDPELNKNHSPLSGKGIYLYNSEYCYYYNDLFQSLSVEMIPLSMGLDWFVDLYDDVYTGEKDFFYLPFSSYDMDYLLEKYNGDPNRLYYLKPFLDCYLLMDNSKKPSEEELEEIKATIIYALEYYINGKDFIGTLN